jgi:hypothetical protein
MANTELEKKGPQNTALDRPDWIPKSQEGLDEIGMKDMVLPRMTLCQTNTKARIRTEPKYIPGLQEGQFFNSVTGRIYGESVLIIPLFFYHSRIMFKDMDQGGGIICQAPDGKSCQLNAGGPCIHAAWGPAGEPPECTEFYNYPVLVYEGPGNLTSEWVVVSLKTTGLNAGRNLNSLMRLRGGPAFSGVYELSSIPDKNDAGQPFFTWVVKNAIDPATTKPMWVDQEIFPRAQEMSRVIKEGLKAGTVTVSDIDPDSPDAEKAPF